MFLEIDGLLGWVWGSISLRASLCLLLWGCKDAHHTDLTL